MSVGWLVRSFVSSFIHGADLVLQIGEIFGRIVGLMKQAWNLVHR